MAKEDGASISMAEKNPFTLSFGRVPNEYIDRGSEERQIVDMFTSLPVTEQIYILLGVRGSGKTVTMTNVAKQIDEMNDWIVIKISPIDNILDALYRILVYNPKVHQVCVDAKLDISLLGVSVSLSSKLPEPNIIQAIDDILKTLAKRNINVLVTIDEITATDQMCAFVSAFQLFITNNRPIFFLGTALFEKFEDLKNVPNLTFLYRAPKIVLTPLNALAMAQAYMRVLNITKQQALGMASITKGYSLAFQILGYVQWDKGEQEFLSDAVLDEFDIRIADAAYNKLWSELSETDRIVMRGIAKCASHNVKDIRETLNMDANKFNQYRKRLSMRGLIDVSKYGIIEFALPRFAEFIATFAEFE